MSIYIYIAAFDTCLSALEPCVFSDGISASLKGTLICSVSVIFSNTELLSKTTEQRLVRNDPIAELFERGVFLRILLVIILESESS